MRGEAMEYESCEQYVLGELEEAQADNDRLRGENERLGAQCSILQERLDALSTPSRMQEYITEQGRRYVFDACSYADVTDARYPDGSTVPFRTWCEDSLRDYGRTDWLTADEFIEEFDPEFRAEYERKLGEA